MTHTKPSLVLLSLFTFGWVACNGDDTSDTGASSTGDDHGHTTDTGHATGTSTGHDDTATDDHATDDHATDDHATDDHATDDHGTDTTADDPAAAYCACMLANCHDQYHGTWGEDHKASEAACLMEAEGLPVNGSDIDMGNFLECRLHFCELAAGDESLCVNAIGDAVCI